MTEPFDDTSPPEPKPITGDGEDMPTDVENGEIVDDDEGVDE